MMNIFDYGEEEIRRNAPIKVACGEGGEVEVRPLPIGKACEWMAMSEVVKRIEGVELVFAQKMYMLEMGKTVPSEEELGKYYDATLSAKRRLGAEMVNLVKQYFGMQGGPEPAWDGVSFAQLSGMLSTMQMLVDPTLASGMYQKSLVQSAGSGAKKG